MKEQVLEDDGQKKKQRKKRALPVRIVPALNRVPKRSDGLSNDELLRVWKDDSSGYCKSCQTASSVRLQECSVLATYQCEAGCEWSVIDPAFR